MLEFQLVSEYKEINRSNLSTEEAERLLNTDIVRKQLEMLRFRNTCPVFTEDAEITTECNETKMTIEWSNQYGKAKLRILRKKTIRSNTDNNGLWQADREIRLLFVTLF